jgi:hypothetical protein
MKFKIYGAYSWNYGSLKEKTKNAKSNLSDKYNFQSNEQVVEIIK